MRGTGETCWERGKHAGSRGKMQGAGERCRELGGKMQGSGKKCRELGKYAGSRGKMQSWGKMQAEPEENVGRWRKMQGGGERCKELVGGKCRVGKNARSQEKNAGRWGKKQGFGKKCRELGIDTGSQERMQGAGKDAEILAVAVFLQHPHGAQSFGQGRAGSGAAQSTWTGPSAVPRCPGWILLREVLLGGHLHPTPSGRGFFSVWLWRLISPGSKREP